jgi:hypothetical protein
MLRTKLPDRQDGDLLRIARAVQADLEDLAGHDLANRIVAINQMQAIEGQVESLSQSFGIFRSDPAPLE